MSEPVWKTREGRIIPVRWMASAHLIHAFNMAMRNNGMSSRDIPRVISNPKNDVFRAIWKEVNDRGLVSWHSSGTQLKATTLREKPAELCMLRAILDTKPENCEEIVEHFKQSPHTYIKHVLNCADPKWTPVVAKFTEYRLEHA